MCANGHCWLTNSVCGALSQLGNPQGNYLDAMTTNIERLRVTTPGLEFRPFQGINWTWPSGRIPLDHYVRVEERFDFETADWTLDASLRLRYRIQTDIRLGALREVASWRIIGHAEAFGTTSTSGSASSSDG